MKVWLIEHVEGFPPLYISESNGVTYQRLKARRHETKQEAEARIKVLKLSNSWRAMSHDL